VTMSAFGDFGDFCRDSNLVVCNLFPVVPSCVLTGFETANGHRIRNLGKNLRLSFHCSVLSRDIRADSEFRGHDIMFYCGLYVVISLSSNGEKKGCSGYVVVVLNWEG